MLLISKLSYFSTWMKDISTTLPPLPPQLPCPPETPSARSARSPAALSPRKPWARSCYQCTPGCRSAQNLQKKTGCLKKLYIGLYPYYIISTIVYQNSIIFYSKTNRRNLWKKHSVHLILGGTHLRPRKRSVPFSTSPSPVAATKLRVRLACPAPCLWEHSPQAVHWFHSQFLRSSAGEYWKWYNQEPLAIKDGKFLGHLCKNLGFPLPFSIRKFSKMGGINEIQTNTS